jgi:FkbM family methyltransferase
MKPRMVVVKDGTRFMTRSVADRWIIDEVYGPNTYKALGFKIKNNFLVIDIGAHIGIFTIAAAKSADRVFSYEPEPGNFSYLKKNLLLNKIKNVFYFNKGVFDKKGTQRLYLHSSIKHSIFDASNKSVVIQTVSLADIFEENNIKLCHLLKIDTEGCEYEILSSTPKKYFRMIGSIVLESHNDIKKNELSKLGGVLTENGFEIRKIGVNNDCLGVNMLFAEKSSRPRFVVFINNHFKLAVNFVRMLFIHNIFLNVIFFVNRKIGRAGFFLKKHFPSLYQIVRINRTK